MSYDSCVNTCDVQGMPPTDHNGEDFHYIVSYKLAGGEEKKQKVMDVRTADSSRREYVVEGQEMFKEYEIAVQAGNQEGLAPSHTVERKIGFSGQGGEYSDIDIASVNSLMVHAAALYLVQCNMTQYCTVTHAVNVR